MIRGNGRDIILGIGRNDLQIGPLQFAQIAVMPQDSAVGKHNKSNILLHLTYFIKHILSMIINGIILQ